MKTLSLSLLALLLSSSIFSQDSTKVEVPKRIYTTASISSYSTPEIDGILNDDAWNAVEWTTDYIENQPDENTPPTEQTKMKIAYDDKNIYVAFRCYDAEPENIVKRLSRRDGFEGDWVEVNFDSFNDDRTGFSFTVTAAGVKGDEFISNNGNFDGSYNPIWYVKTNIDTEGWTAEMRIPLSQLRFSADQDQVWGLQSTRRYFRAEERSLWQRLPADAPGFVSEFGELRGLVGLKPQKQLEIQPFILGQQDVYEEERGNPFRDGADTKLNAGLDAKIGITNDLTLDLTINPDFGQVEADPAAIALDGFQLFFQEQRPFFVANSNIFNYSLDNFSPGNLFYSRRIGRSPQGFAQSDNIQYTNQPNNTTIYGAAKFSGKTKNGWSLGIIESVTAKEFVEIIDFDNQTTEQIVEPLTNYFVGRAQKDFNDRNSYIGTMFTATNRDLEDGQFLNFLRRDAYSAGIDFKHNWKDRKYYLEGMAYGSHVKGSKEAIARTQQSLTHLFGRVDAGHVEIDTTRTSLSGTGGRLEIGKASGGNFRAHLGGTWRSPELELNDIGFLRRADEIRQYARLSYQTLKPFGNFRRINAQYRHYNSFDFDGNYNVAEHRLDGFAQFKNNWGIETGFIHKPRNFNVSTLRGGPRFRFSKENINYFFIGSDSRKKFVYSGGYVISEAVDKQFTYLELSARMSYQPTDALNLSIRPVYSKNPNQTQYVATREVNGTSRYITANIEQQTLSAQFRLNYTFTPNFSLQFYAQPFVSTGRYSNFNYITDATADNLEDRFQLYNDNQISLENGTYNVDDTENGTTDYSFSNPDFAFSQLNTNLVLRWEYIPGSELFLVWSLNGNAFEQPDNHIASTLTDFVTESRHSNTFLLKATYRFVL